MDGNSTNWDCRNKRRCVNCVVQGSCKINETEFVWDCCPLILPKVDVITNPISLPDDGCSASRESDEGSN